LLVFIIFIFIFIVIFILLQESGVGSQQWRASQGAPASTAFDPSQVSADDDDDDEDED
jgi:preprotein translocase subunit SecG